MASVVYITTPPNPSAMAQEHWREKHPDPRAGFVFGAVLAQPKLSVSVFPKAPDLKYPSKGILEYRKSLWKPGPVTLNVRRNPGDLNSVSHFEPAATLVRPS